MKKLLFTILALSSISSFADVGRSFICEDSMNAKIHKLNISARKIEKFFLLSFLAFPLGPATMDMITNTREHRRFNLKTLRDAMRIAHLTKEEWAEAKNAEMKEDIQKIADFNFKYVNEERLKVGIPKLSKPDFEDIMPEKSFKGLMQANKMFLLNEACDEICDFVKKLKFETNIDVDYDKLKNYLADRRHDDELCPNNNVIKGSKKSLKNLVNRIQVYY